MVTSGNFSPMLETGIALALVHPDTAIGDAVVINGRGRTMPAQVVGLPFVPKTVLPGMAGSGKGS
jgi:aminomethyltransferase